MSGFQAKSLGRRIVYSRPAFVVLLILAVVVARPVWGIWQRSRAVTEERAQVATQLAELEARKAFLEKEVAALQTARGVEGEIRKKFPVVREGEKVIIVGGETTVVASTTATTTWWQRFFGRD